jgi:hypothetical protein
MKPNKSCVGIFIEENRTLHMELHQLQPNSQFHSDAMPPLLWRHLVVLTHIIDPILSYKYHRVTM